MEANPDRVEAERLLGIAEKLLQSRDLNGSREFAVLAQETEPLLDGSDQIMAVVDVLASADRRVNNHHQDWYAILEADPSDEAEQIKRKYRRLALLLHPDKNRFPFADQAFRLVSQAWAVLSDPAKKPAFDSERAFSRVELTKLSGSRSVPAKARTFWTVCPYCYVLFEYPRVYEECCLRCQRCEKAFQAVALANPPPAVSGEEAYHCCWAVFPLGFSFPASAPAFPNWMPPLFPN